MASEKDDYKAQLGELSRRLRMVAGVLEHVEIDDADAPLGLVVRRVLATTGVNIAWLLASSDATMHDAAKVRAMFPSTIHAQPDDAEAEPLRRLALNLLADNGPLTTARVAFLLLSHARLALRDESEGGSELERDMIEAAIAACDIGEVLARGGVLAPAQSTPVRVDGRRYEPA